MINVKSGFLLAMTIAAIVCREGCKMSKRYVVYVEDGERPPKGAMALVGTFFQEEDVASVYESLLDGVEESDPRYAAHQSHIGLMPGDGEFCPCWDALTRAERAAYLEKADKYLEEACTYDWVDVVEQAITDADNPL